MLANPILTLVARTLSEAWVVVADLVAGVERGRVA